MPCELAEPNRLAPPAPRLDHNPAAPGRAPFASDVAALRAPFVDKPGHG